MIQSLATSFLEGHMTEQSNSESAWLTISVGAPVTLK
jgi:hypothetical protein